MKPANCWEKENFSIFKNILLWQVKTFDVVQARYIELRATKNTQNNNAVGDAELDIITK